MRPLSARQKQLIYDHLIHGRLRPIAQPLYDSLIALELLWARTRDALHGPAAGASELLPDITAVIKTFERPRAARRLISSIRRCCPGLAIVVADDSQTPTHFEHVDNLHLPYNIGISAGRNAALEHVTTPWVLMLDDDFVFHRHTAIDPALAMMATHSDIDIMGGQVIDLPLITPRSYKGATVFPTDRQPLRPLGSTIGGLTVVDKVPNFFIGRRQRLMSVGWDPQLKLLEHADFFTRARGRLLSVFNPNFSVLHARTPFDAAYLQFRHDTLKYQAILHHKYFRSRCEHDVGDQKAAR